jgi:alpha-N-acetylglucosamine transferase
MKQMIYQVAVGNQSSLYQHCIRSVNQYCNKYNIQHIVQTNPILKIKPDLKRTGRSKEAVQRLGYLPIFEKENAFSHINDFDQIAIIDSDIYVRPDAPNIFEDLPNQYAFGAVAERELPCAKKYKSKIRKYSKSAFSNLTDVDWKWNELGAEFYNMGMMVINCKQFAPYLKGQSPKEFISRKEFKDFVDGVGFYKWSTDQMLLNWWVKKEKIPTKNLDWRWNGLYKGIDDNRLSEAYFVHFFLKDHLPQKGENVPALMEAIN